MPIDDVFERSHLTDLIGRVERGEALDLSRVLALQSLDVARIGEQFVRDALQAERSADDDTIERLKRNRQT